MVEIWIIPGYQYHYHSPFQKIKKYMSRCADGHLVRNLDNTRIPIPLP